VATSKPKGVLGSWLDVTMDQGACPDQFMLIVPAADPDVPCLIADGSLDIPVHAPGPGTDVVLRLILPGRPLWAALIDALSSMRVVGDIDDDGHIRVHCHAVIAQPGGRELAICVGFNPPHVEEGSIPKRLKDAAIAAVSTHRSQLARIEAERALKQIEDELFIDSLPSKQRETFQRAAQLGAAMRPFEPPLSAVPLVPLCPWGMAVPVRNASPSMVEKSALAAIRSMPNPLHPPPRDGHYQCQVMSANPKRVMALITWTPHTGLPSYPEVRAAVARRLPSALRKPRLTGATPPAFDTARLAPLGQPVGLGGFDTRDPSWMDAFAQQQEYDFGNRRDRSERARAATKAHGFEAIAWYQSHHSYTEEWWGIYFNAEMLDDAVCSLSDDLRRAGFTRGTDSLASKLLVAMVYEHEQFHARVDAASTWLELNANQARFRRYNENAYRPTFETVDCLEEALANFWGWSWFKAEVELQHIYGALTDVEKTKLERVVEAMLDLSPPGYDQWRRGHERDAWRVLATQVASGKVTMPAPGMALPMESTLRGALPFDFQPWDVPVYFVGDGQVARRLLSSPSTLNVPARKELRRALEHVYGYSLVPGGGKGSHEKWRGKDGRMFPVPRKDPVGRGVFEAFLNHFGIDKREYIERVRQAL
jgi:hypothetical protein